MDYGLVDKKSDKQASTCPPREGSWGLAMLFAAMKEHLVALCSEEAGRSGSFVYEISF